MSTHSRARTARTLGVLSLLVGLVLTTGSGAFAASKTVRDTTGDTYSAVGDAKPTRAPGAVADIVSVTTKHRARAVLVRIRVRDLGTGMSIGIVQIKTSNPGRAFFLTGMSTEGFKMVGLTKGRDGKDVGCHGLRMAFQGAKDAVVAQIPRSCLGNPRWVRTGALLVSSNDDTSLASDSFSGSVDIAGIDVIGDSFWSDDAQNLPLGPKVRRG